MSKLEEIKKLMDGVEIGQLIEPDYKGMVDLTDSLTPFGEFIIKLEHILQRDDNLIQELSQRLSKEKG